MVDRRCLEDKTPAGLMICNHESAETIKEKKTVWGKSDFFCAPNIQW